MVTQLHLVEHDPQYSGEQGFLLIGFHPFAGKCQNPHGEPSAMFKVVWQGVGR